MDPCSGWYRRIFNLDKNVYVTLFSSKCTLLSHLCFVSVDGYFVLPLYSTLTDTCSDLLVNIGPNKSSVTFLVCGVPQGSVLLYVGPILLVLYTVDLLSVIENYGLTPHMYADDGSCPLTAVTAFMSNISECIEAATFWVRSKAFNGIQTRQNSSGVRHLGTNTSHRLRHCWLAAAPSTQWGLHMLNVPCQDVSAHCNNFARFAVRPPPSWIYWFPYFGPPTTSRWWVQCPTTYFGTSFLSLRRRNSPQDENTQTWRLLICLLIYAYP